MTDTEQSYRPPVVSLCCDDSGATEGLMPVRRQRRFPTCPRCGAPNGQPCAVTPGKHPEGGTLLVHEQRRPLELFPSDFGGRS